MITTSATSQNWMEKKKKTLVWVYQKIKNIIWKKKEKEKKLVWVHQKKYIYNLGKKKKKKNPQIKTHKKPNNKKPFS